MDDHLTWGNFTRVTHAFRHWTGSPGCNKGRTFRAEFRWTICGRHPAKRKVRKIYRNPVALALEWRQAIDSGDYSSQADLAKRKGVSRARVTQILNLLRLAPRVIGIVMDLGDPLPAPTVTERQLRRLINRSVRDQLKEIMIIPGLIRTGGNPADGS